MSEQLTVEEVPKLKVTELKTELAARDLPTKGRKQELAERLVEHLQGSESQEQNQDPAGQTSSEAPQLADAAQANTESLPSEMPAVPPANEDSVQDLEGAEPKLSETAAANGVETAPGQSEVVRPDVNSLDQTPGVVSSSGADTNGSADVGEKRKRDDEPASEPAVLPLNAAPESVAAQAETAEPGNDSVPAPPVDVEEPDTKRLKTDDDAAAAGSADIPVPSASGDPTSDIPVPGASSDTSASLLAPQADPILPLNEAIVPDTSNAVPSGSEDPTKSVQVPSSSTVKGTASSSSSSSSTLPHTTTADPSNLQSHRSFSIRGKGAEKRSGRINEEVKAKIGDMPDTSVDLDRRGSSPNSVAKMSHIIAAQPGNIQSEHQRSASDDASHMDLDAPLNKESPASRSRSSLQNEGIPKASSSVDASMHTDGDAKTADNEKPPPSTSICVSGLTRPFALSSLKETLEEYGSYSYFWINVIRSHCFVTYGTLETAEEVSEMLDGAPWPGRTGPRLSVVYLPDSEVPRLVAKEESAGRARLELVVTRDPSTSDWLYDVAAPSEPANPPARNAAGQARGLASALPASVRPGTSNPFPLGTPATAPPTSLAARAGAGPPGSRLFQQANSSRASVMTASGASIQISRSSAFSQSTLPGPAPRTESARRRDEDSIWQPARGAESTYKQTQSMPKIWFRPVDAVTAGSKLRDLAREKRKTASRRSTGIRDSYRP